MCVVGTYAVIIKPQQTHTNMASLSEQAQTRLRDAFLVTEIVAQILCNQTAGNLRFGTAVHFLVLHMRIIHVNPALVWTKPPVRKPPYSSTPVYCKDFGYNPLFQCHSEVGGFPAKVSSFCHFGKYSLFPTTSLVCS